MIFSSIHFYTHQAGQFAFVVEISLAAANKLFLPYLMKLTSTRENELLKKSIATVLLVVVRSRVQSQTKASFHLLLITLNI